MFGGVQRESWLVLACTWLIGFLLSALIQCASPLLPLIMDEFKLTHWEGGIFYSIPVAVTTLFAYPLGLLSDRVGVEQAIAMGSTLAAGSTVLRGMSTSFEFLVATTVLFGFGWGLGLASLSKVVRNYFPPGIATTAMGIATTGMPLGSGTGIALTRPVISLLGGDWSTAFQAWGLFGVLVSLVWAVTLLLYLKRRTANCCEPTDRKESPAERSELVEPRKGARANGGRGGSGTEQAHASSDKAHNPFFAAGALNSSPVFIVAICGVLLSLANIMFFCTIGWLPTHLAEKGMSSVLAAVITSLILYIQVPAVLFVPMLADRTGKKKAILIWTYAVIGVGMVLLAGSRTLWLAVVLLGIAFGAVYPMLMAVPAELDGIQQEQVGRAAGLLLSLGHSGALIGPPVAGQLRDVTGNFTMSFLALTVFAICGVILCRWLPQRFSVHQHLTIMGGR